MTCSAGEVRGERCKQCICKSKELVAAEKLAKAIKDAARRTKDATIR